MNTPFARRLALALATTGFFLAAPMPQAQAGTVTYTWTGDCFDCNPAPVGTAVVPFNGVATTEAKATLTLGNYTPGASVVGAQFVFFHYHSNLFDESTNVANFMTGLLPAAPGGPANFHLEWPGGVIATDFYVFNTSTDGTWQFFEAIGSNLNLNDTGNNSVFRIPEPGTLALLGIALTALGMGSRRRRPVPG